MNKAELTAICLIAEKMNWQNKPVMEVCETIKQIVRNQQALELDCIGECDDFEETLLSIATWDIDKIVSCLYTWDYQTHTAYWQFLKETGMSGLDFYYWMTDYQDVLAAEYAAEEDAYQDYLDDCYWDMIETQMSCRY